MFITVAISISVTFVSSLFITTHIVTEELELESKNSKDRLTIILPALIWNMQYDTVAQIIATEIQNSSIDAIIIKDIDGSIISSKIKNQAFADTNCTFNKKFTLIYANEKIAFVEVYFNTTKLQSAIDNEAKEQILIALVLMILIFLIFRFAVNKAVISNLTTLKNYIAKFADNKNFSDELQLDTNDEFSFIAREFNVMRKKLGESWKEFETLNLHLEDIIKKEVEKNRQKDKQLYEQSKLAQMGEMLGNIAHQWRQPLSAISTIASGTKLQKELNIIDDKELLNSFDDIVKQTQFLSQTIEDFRSFLKAEKEKDEFDVNQIIEKTLFIVKSTLKNNSIDVVLDLSEDKLIILGYQGEISQVLLNILNNAKDILLEREIENKEIKIKSYMENYKAIIEITDNAKGIPDVILPKIFDPYFTTKHQSVGTGIGLFMCKQIIEKHHRGEIIASNIDNGAKFTIILNSI